MCLNQDQLKTIYKLSKKKIKITSNLVLRTNSLFSKFKRKISNKRVYYIEGDYILGRKNKLFVRSKLINIH